MLRGRRILGVRGAGGVDVIGHAVLAQQAAGVAPATVPLAQPQAIHIGGQGFPVRASDAGGLKHFAIGVHYMNADALVAAAEVQRQRILGIHFDARKL